MLSADTVRESLERASKEVLHARSLLNLMDLPKLAGELSACDIILSELIRPGVIEQCSEEKG